MGADGGVLRAAGSASELSLNGIPGASGLFLPDGIEFVAPDPSRSGRICSRVDLVRAPPGVPFFGGHPSGPAFAGDRPHLRPEHPPPTCYRQEPGRTPLARLGTPDPEQVARHRETVPEPISGERADAIADRIKPRERIWLHVAARASRNTRHNFFK